MQPIADAWKIGSGAAGDGFGGGLMTGDAVELFDEQMPGLDALALGEAGDVWR